MFRSVALTLMVCLATVTAQATAVSGQGTWETTLQGRAPLTPGGTDYQAYYDTELDITWLADANYSDTSGYDDDGVMDWTSALDWTNSLNAAGYLGQVNWRLPLLTDTGPAGCDAAYTGTDCGYHVDVSTSELASLYYETLGNSASNDADGNYNVCVLDYPIHCLSNTGPFANMMSGPGMSNDTWFGTEYREPEITEPLQLAWVFSLSVGYQIPRSKDTSLRAWAVSPGDIAAVPLPGGLWLLATGLGVLGWRRWKVTEKRDV